VPRVPEGRTELRDSMYVVRAGSSATVYFDTPLARTRRRDKFEAIVRATLPAVYGAAADSLLAAVPAGRLVRQGDDLLGALPTRGLRLPAGAGWSVALWPETRAGQQGPLVVAYRATVVR
jgi:hypothetical protein